MHFEHMNDGIISEEGEYPLWVIACDCCRVRQMLECEFMDKGSLFVVPEL